jgi:Holliday junction DNA helicase RuvB
MDEKHTPERQISPQPKSGDKKLDGLLRPQYLAEFTGQERLKANLTILIEAARGRKEPTTQYPILFHCPAHLKSR